MTGRCRGTIVYQTCQPIYSQSYQAPPPPPQHTPTDIAVSEPSDGCRSTYSSIITFTVPDGHVTGMTINGSWGNGTSIPSSGWQYLISPGNSSSSNFQNSAITYTRNGNQVTIGVRHGFTGTLNIGGRAISTQIQQTPSVPELQNPIQGTTPPTVTGPPPSQPDSNYFLNFRASNPAGPSPDPLYSQTIHFDFQDPHSRVSVSYNGTANGTAVSGSTRNLNNPYQVCGGSWQRPIEESSDISGVLYAHRRSGHLGIGIIPGFRGQVTFTIIGTDGVRRTHIVNVGQPRPIPPLLNDMLSTSGTPRITPPPITGTPITPGVDFTSITASNIVSNNLTTPPPVTSQNLTQAITNFRLLQNSFLSTNGRVFWRHPTEERNLTREEMLRASLYMSNYAREIARIATQNTVRQEFTNLSSAYRSVYSSHGL